MTDSLPPLKTDPKHGYFPWWPEDGDDWVHPEDVQAARRMIPSQRVWRRDGAVGRDGEFVVMHYGETRLRVRRTLWREVRPEGLEIGQWVEVLTRGMAAEPHTGQVAEMRYDEHAGVIRYSLRLADGAPLERAYEAHELQPIQPPKPREEARREPPAEDPGDMEVLEP